MFDRVHLNTHCTTELSCDNRLVEGASSVAVPLGGYLSEAPQADTALGSPRGNSRMHSDALPVACDEHAREKRETSMLTAALDPATALQIKQGAALMNGGPGPPAHLQELPSTAEPTEKSNLTGSNRELGEGSMHDGPTRRVCTDVSSPQQPASPPTTTSRPSPGAPPSTLAAASKANGVRTRPAAGKVLSLGAAHHAMRMKDAAMVVSAARKLRTYRRSSVALHTDLLRAFVPDVLIHVSDGVPVTCEDVLIERAIPNK